jgi:ubiquinol-cytochrome c reductase cytochrome c subunit
MTEAQIHQLAAYVASLGPGGPMIPDVTGYQQADVAYGGALFRTNCAQCHNFVGAGGELTYAKYAPSLSKATPTQIYEAMVTGPENMPVFGDRTLTHEQKLAIIKYVTSIRAQADPGGAGLGRIGPVSETVVAILVGLGLCVVAAIWVGSRA